MDRKRRGELSELAFLFKATGLGFNVSKPYGDSSRYDFVVEHLGRLSKVQVKSTTRCDGAYYLNVLRRVNGGREAYRAGDFDYLAAYVAPEDAWYIIPFDKLVGSYYLLLWPQKPANDRKWGRYREAWDLLDGLHAAPVPCFPIDIDACAEDVGKFTTDGAEEMSRYYVPPRSACPPWKNAGFPTRTRHARNNGASVAASSLEMTLTLQ